MNILLIEDNENISDGLKYSLEKEKYHVMVCVSIEDTIKYLEENNFIRNFIHNHAISIM